MKKKVLSLLVVLLAMVFAFQAVAQYDDDYAPRRRRGRVGGWRGQMLTRTLSVNVGMWRALNADIEDPSGGTSNLKFENPEWLFSVGAKLWFYRSNWGIGVDALLLNSYDVEGGYSYYDKYGFLQSTSENYRFSEWLVDLDLYYRLPITPSLLVVGGAGLTYYVLDTDNAPGFTDQSSQVGYNLKLGGELFVDQQWSISGMFTWHHFQRTGMYLSTAGAEGDSIAKMVSFMFQVNLYL